MLVKLKPFILLGLSVAMLLVVACGAQPEPAAQNSEQSQEAATADEEHQSEEAEDAHSEEGLDEDEHEHDEQAEEHEYAETTALSAVDLAEGEKLKVVATTNIVGDLAANVGGDKIELTTMLPIGADPHTFDPTPQDAAAVADAQVVFVNGLHLEEFLEELIENAGGQAPVVALSTNVETREFEEMEGHNGEKQGDHHDEEEHDEDDHAHDEEAEEHEHDEDEHDEEAEEHNEDDHAHEDEHGHHHEGIDPHIWMSPANAMVMVRNIEQALSQLDPANAESYKANAAAYQTQLEELDAWVKSQIETIPAENRKLVTDHDAFGYYANRYGLDVVGAVIPAYSTNAEPSAQELVELQKAIDDVDARAVFVGTTVNPVLAERISEDTGIKLVPLYTGSLGQPGSGVESYLELMRYNTSAIVEALK